MLAPSPSFAGVARALHGLRAGASGRRASPRSPPCARSVKATTNRSRPGAVARRADARAARRRAAGRAAAGAARARRASRRGRRRAARGRSCGHGARRRRRVAEQVRRRGSCAAMRGRATDRRRGRRARALGRGCPPPRPEYVGRSRVGAEPSGAARVVIDVADEYQPTLAADAARGRGFASSSTRARSLLRRCARAPTSRRPARACASAACSPRTRPAARCLRGACASCARRHGRARCCARSGCVPSETSMPPRSRPRSARPERERARGLARRRVAGAPSSCRERCSDARRTRGSRSTTRRAPRSTRSAPLRARFPAEDAFETAGGSTDGGGSGASGRARGSWWETAKRPQLEWLAAAAERLVVARGARGVQRVVDIGGGKGNLANVIAARLGAEAATVRVVDVADSALERGRARARAGASQTSSTRARTRATRAR